MYNFLLIFPSDSLPVYNFGDIAKILVKKNLGFYISRLYLTALLLVTGLEFHLCFRNYKKCHPIFPWIIQSKNEPILIIFGWLFVLKRFTLCYRTTVLSVCPVLSVTLVFCGQMVGPIKMKPGMRVGLCPGHIVLDGDGSRCHLVWT